MKFLNISLQDKPLQKLIIKDIRKIINNTDFILGKSTKKFEKKFAKYCESNTQLDVVMVQTHYI